MEIDINSVALLIGQLQLRNLQLTEQLAKALAKNEKSESGETQKSQEE